MNDVQRALNEGKKIHARLELEAYLHIELEAGLHRKVEHMKYIKWMALHRQKHSYSMRVPPRHPPYWEVKGFI